MDRPAPVVALFHSLNGGGHGVNVGAGITAVAACSLVRAAHSEVIVAPVAIVVVYESHVVDRGREEVSARPLAGWESLVRANKDVVGKAVGLEARDKDRDRNVGNRAVVDASRRPDRV